MIEMGKKLVFCIEKYMYLQINFDKKALDDIFGAFRTN
jgi:hypothetical protein